MARSGRREAVARTFDGVAVAGEVAHAALASTGHVASAIAAKAIATLAREAAAAIRRNG